MRHVALLLLFARLVVSQTPPLFSPATGSPFPAGASPSSIAPGDFNGDGIVDLAVANPSTNTVTVLLGNANGGYTAAAGSPIPTGRTPQALAAADFNGDGKLDIAVVNAGDNNVWLFFGDGTGKFTNSNQRFLTGGSPAAIVTGNFNGDSLPDLAIPNSADNSVTVLLSSGPGFFFQASGSPFLVGTNPSALAIGDFNRDGRQDIAVANLVGNNITILLANTNGGFTATSTPPLLSAASPTSLAVADFNTDGNLDLAITNPGAGKVNILFGDGTGAFTALTSPIDVGTQPVSIATADFNRDGKADLAVAVLNSGTVIILLGDGHGQFTQPPGTPLAAGTNPVSLVIADLNGDGRPDLVIANNLLTANLTILLNSVPALTANPAQLTVSGAVGGPIPAPIKVSIGSVSGPLPAFTATIDQPWLALTGISGSTATISTNPTGLAAGTYRGTVRLTAPNYTGSTITVALNLVNPSAGFAPSITGPLPSGTTPSSVAVADFNNDGKLDVAITNSTGSDAVILLGDGAGRFNFSPGSPVTVGTAPSAIVAGDFNGDGKQDIAIAANTGQNVTVLLGDGSGGFFPASGSPFAIGGSASSLAAADFNGDGFLDLAVGSNSFNANRGFTILLGNGTGNFVGAPFSLPMNVNPLALVIGDFNGDGRPDLAIGDSSSNALLVFLNNPVNGFTLSAKLTGINQFGTYSLAVADLNGDGKLDLIANSSQITAFLGDGRGGFVTGPASPVQLPPGFSSLPLAVGDFNGDGKLDLVVGVNQFNNIGVAVLLGNGTGALNPVVGTVGTVFPLGSAPSVVAAGDFNGDGKTDLLASSASTISTLLGTGVATTMTTLFVASNFPQVPLQTVTLTAQVANQSFAAAAGTVRFRDGSSTLGTAPLLNGAAVFKTTALGLGPHNLFADYLGDTLSAVSTSAGVSITMSAGSGVSVALTHTGNFALGQTGTYTIAVMAIGTVPLNGVVTVTEQLPTGLTLVSMQGSGWSCAGVSCARSDSLSPGASYAPITVTVNVSPSATQPVLNTVSVSGGGFQTVNDLTIIGTPPFGFVDTPPNYANNLAGAIGITGWALGQAAVSSVAIYREPLSGEGTNNLVFIGTATFVTGTRPDVAAGYPTYPNSNRAGWGYQLLTNQLAGTNGQPLGNGAYKIHAIATDVNGATADLGTVAISVDNAASALPFGTIDTPAQGATISGAAYVNFGWALTPQPACLALDGSGITVFIDNVAVGHPTYNQPRSDIQTLFPGYCNTNGAIGFFTIDTTKLTNGLHSISWGAVDNAGHAGGLGSRYFTVQN